MNWSPEQCRMLVQEMRNYPCLWDKGTEDYRKGVVKHEAKRAIGEKLGIPTHLIDAKIKSILTQLHREIRRKKGIKAETGSAIRSTSTWYLLPDLMYVLNAKIRNALSSESPEDLCIEIQDSEDSPEKTDVGFVESGEEILPGDMNSAIDCNEENEQNDVDTERLSLGPSRFRNSSRRNRIAAWKRKFSKTDDILSKAVKSLANLQTKANSDNTVDADEWDFFGGLIAKKMRNLRSPEVRLRAESEIHSVLLKAQADDLGCPVLYVNRSSESNYE